MNIHEYQAKALLADYGVATLRAGSPTRPRRRRRRRASWAGRSGSSRRRSTPAAAARAAASSSPARSSEVRQLADDMLGMTLVTHQTGPQGRVVKRVYVEEGCNIARELYLGAVDRPRQLARHAHGLDRGRRRDRGGGASTAGEDPARSRSTRRPASCRSTAASSPTASASRARRSARRSSSCSGALRVHGRARRLAGRDQPAGRHRRGRPGGARRQDELRQQRPLPPAASRRAARPRRGGPAGDRGQPARAQLHQARRQHRLHGQRRRPRHGDDGHHQAVSAASRRTSSTSAAAPPRSGSRPPSSCCSPTRTSRACWSTSSAASCAAT